MIGIVKVDPGQIDEEEDEIDEDDYDEPEDENYAEEYAYDGMDVIVSECPKCHKRTIVLEITFQTADDFGEWIPWEIVGVKCDCEYSKEEMELEEVSEIDLYEWFCSENEQQLNEYESMSDDDGNP